MQFPHQTGGIGATIDDRLVTMEKIVQRAVIKIEERSQNDVILIDGWQGWMPSTVEKRGTIVDVLADDCSHGIEYSGPLDNGTGYWE